MLMKNTAKRRKLSQVQERSKIHDILMEKKLSVICKLLKLLVFMAYIWKSVLLSIVAPSASQAVRHSKFSLCDYTSEYIPFYIQQTFFRIGTALTILKKNV